MTSPLYENMEKEIKFHDPLILQDGGAYYCFSTDTHLQGVQISKSDDLLHWRLHKTALVSIPGPVKNHVGDAKCWAPEVIRYGDIYRLYFCASSFGTSQSVIGLAESESIDGDYQFKGAAVQTYGDSGVDLPNAIDPNIVWDRDGSSYLVYGSFFGGIYMAPLNAEGFPACKGYGTCIAGGRHTPVEGPYIYYDPGSDYFYLFLSYGSLRYDYNIRVAKSRNILGPYMDSQGIAMTNLDPVLSPGDKIAGGYHFDQPDCTGFMGPGHNSILQMPDGPYIVHHIRREGYVEFSYMQLRKLFFTPQGQVYVSPAPYDGTTMRPADKSHMQGEISFIRHDRWNNGVTYGRKLPLPSLPYAYDEASGSFSVNLYGKDYTGKAFIQGYALYITAVSPDGECLWGRGKEEIKSP